MVVRQILWVGVLTLLMVSVPMTTDVRAQPAAQAPGGIPPFVWALTHFPGVGEITEPRYSIQFLADGTVAIGADCNRAAGTWVGGSGTLDITVTMTTLVGCPPDSLEQPFLQALDGVTGYTLTGSTLILHGAAGDMTFSS